MGQTINEAIKNNILALIVEATEVLNEVQWKPWRRHIHEINKEALKEEIADCLAFIFNISYEAGMTNEDLAKCLYDKQDKNMERFK